MHASLYGLRHGGASHDGLMQIRSATEILERGRWSGSHSLRRYKKASRAQMELAKLHPRTLALGQTMATRIDKVFNQPLFATGLRRHLDKQ